MVTMDDVLVDLVLARLDEKPLPDPSVDLLLAAMTSDENLTGLLGGATAPSRPDHPGTAATQRPVGAYLSSLTVSGFRGIGPPASLSLRPGPGLTLILGRNGSGKSTFAEALEALLTGNLSRWKDAKGAQREGWRSIHQPGDAQITADLLVEGTGRATVRRTWPAGAEFTGSSATVQVAGGKVMPGLDQLGWATGLQAHRPFLSHAELAAFSGRPSDLHDVLLSVLGMEDLTVVVDRLAAARKLREKALAEVKARVPGLLRRLGESGDERAAVCLKALNGRTWDVDAVRSAAGVGAVASDGGELARLRSLAALTVPPKDTVQAAVAGLRAAADTLESVAGSAAGQAHALARLLTEALHLHAEHGDSDCPVCRRPGALTQAWRQETEQHVTRLRQEASEAKAAQDEADRVWKQALALLHPLPAALADPLAPAGLSPEAARKAWITWAKPPEAAGPSPDGLRALAGHLETALPPLANELTALAQQAATEFFEREDRWSPIATDLLTWCAAADPARAGAAQALTIKGVETWLKSAADDIRNARLAPLADQARQIWQQLRQESNVDLGEIRLAGTATRRSLELNVSVDGTPGTALGVMSQGEINALALSIFVPRATMPESPFCFLVIDDPVQAMDPAKVDGLGRVLEKASADRQVIVFTHDNRLAEAVRHLRIPATVLEVTRRPKSVVSVRASKDPAGQALDDAFALTSDQKLAPGIAARVVPGLCRTAVEAAFTDAVWRQQASQGRSHEDIMNGLVAAGTNLNRRAALALYGDVDRAGDVHQRLSMWGRSFADTYHALNKGAHDGYGGDLLQLARGAEKLTQKIGSALP
jgi:energy-coupling factor transporter ATP-binding protein EcfA2